MPKTKRPLHEVTQLPFYGKPFPFIPFRTSTEVRLTLVFLRDLYAEVGFLRFVGFWLTLPFGLWNAWRIGREGLRLAGKRFGLSAAFEWALLMVVFDLVERYRGNRVRAYDFVRGAIQHTAPFEMADLYPADEIAQFEDPFEAFWAYHKAMFTGDQNYPNDMTEEENLRIMTVHSCTNCRLAELTIPELAAMGCDHDTIGYPAIADRVGIEFRRPQTLAKHGKPCKFMFFRKGTPVDPELETH